jgi:hypothetical protein
MIWYMNVHIVTSAVFHPIACGAVRSNPIVGTRAQSSGFCARGDLVEVASKKLGL